VHVLDYFFQNNPLSGVDPTGYKREDPDKKGPDRKKIKCKFLKDCKLKDGKNKIYNEKGEHIHTIIVDNGKKDSSGLTSGGRAIAELEAQGYVANGSLLLAKADPADCKRMSAGYSHCPDSYLQDGLDAVTYGAEVITEIGDDPFNFVPGKLVATSTILLYRAGKWYKITSKIDNTFKNVDTQQLGRKLAKHVRDFGGDPSNAADRLYITNKINAIGRMPDRIVRGTFAGQGLNGARGPVDFRIILDDVVVTQLNGTFVTILKNGTKNNESVRRALGKIND